MGLSAIVSDPPKRQALYCTLAAIAGVVVLESVALLTGHDGQLLMLSLAIISGLGGYSLARVVK